MHVNFAKYLVVAERHDGQGYDKVAGRDQERVRTSIEISRNLGTALARTLKIKREKIKYILFFFCLMEKLWGYRYLFR